MTAGCTLTDVFACHCSVRLCWNGAFFMRGWLTIRRTFRAFCAEQGKTALLAQWDIERNLPLTPDDVTFGSHKRVWWTCPNGHSWQAMVYTRSEGTGCPYCTGRKVTPKQGGLVKQFPLLTAEWDIEKNAPLTPQGCDDRQPQAHLVEMPERPFVARDGVFEDDPRHGLSGLHRTAGARRRKRPRDAVPGRCRAVGRDEKRCTPSKQCDCGLEPPRVVAMRKGALLPCCDRAARAARRRLSLLRQPKGAAGLQRLSDRSAARRQTVARDPQRRADTGDGDRGQPQKSVVAVLLRPRVESRDLLPRRRAAVRLPRLRRKNQTQNQVNSARGGGQKIENRR